MPLEIKTAAELVDAAFEARWAARRAGPGADVLRYVLRRFAAHGGPIPLDEVQRAFPTRPAEAVRAELVALDEQDLLVIESDHVQFAYPFAAAPTAFTVVLPDGHRRYACCAIDALGIAPMLRERIAIRSACHHCGAPLELTASPEGPGPDADGVMVWVARRSEDCRRVSTSL